MTSYSVAPPSLPEFDRADPVESAIVNGLVRTWGRRATVKKKEPELDDLFDLEKADFPDEMIPFSGHDTFRALDEDTRNRIRAWAWIAYNKNVMDIEQFVVNPGFRLLAHDDLGTGFGDKHKMAAVQAMVDEEYHTLMHLNASAVTRRRRGWRLPDNGLPNCRTANAHDTAVARATNSREASLIRLAFTTAAESSISGYLALMTETESVQPVNRATVALHRRDELAHASVAGELVRVVFDRLDEPDRRVFTTALASGIDSFTGSDLPTWSAILRAEDVPNADAMLHDVAKPGTRVVQDCSTIRGLCRELGIEEDVAFDW